MGIIQVFREVRFKIDILTCSHCSTTGYLITLLIWVQLFLYSSHVCVLMWIFPRWHQNWNSLRSPSLVTSWRRWIVLTICLLLLVLSYTSLLVSVVIWPLARILRVICCRTSLTWMCGIWILKVAYAFVALFSYPVLSFSPLVSIDKTFFKQPRPVSRRVLEAFIWTLLVVIVALLIPELTQVFSLTGSMCGIALVFVWPSLFYIWIDKREKAKKLTSRVDIFKFSSFSIVFAWILFYVGIVAAVFMTVLEIKKLVAA